MAQLNSHFLDLEKSYLFETIQEKAKKYPNLCNLGIGTASLPLPKSLIDSIFSKIPTLSEKVLGYPPSFGYDFLKKAIQENEYSFSTITEDEIFISNGAKFDLSHLHELFSTENVIGIPNPGYPVYSDSTILSGYNPIFLPCLQENNFLPIPPKTKLDIIYLCSPHNPTGTSFSRKQLHQWVQYALKHQSIIIYDAAYSAFIRSDHPKSIYEVPGAENIAIEVKTFSKTAGLMNFRCSYSIIPKNLPIYGFWKRYSATKLGGVSWISQQIAAATYLPHIAKDLKKTREIYLKNADLLSEHLRRLGWRVFGGVDSPFLWVEIPHLKSSWEFFEELLDRDQIICIPGSGLGKYGEGYVRFSGFAHPDQVSMALQRLSHSIKT